MQRLFSLRWAVVLLSGSLSLAAVAKGASAASPDAGAPDVEAARLIDQLGDPAFASREAAVRRLREIGIPAMEPLRSAANHKTLEIRYRVRRVLQEVEQLDHERRLAEFEKNPEAADDDLLPSLKRFRDTVGSDASSLRMFAELQRAEPALFRLSSQPGAAFDARYEARCGDLQVEAMLLQRRGKIPERVGALLFLASDPRLNESAEAAAMLTGMVQSNEFRTAITGSLPQAAALRKIAGLWVGKPGGGAAYQRMMLAMHLDFREGLVPALAVLKGPGLGFQTQYALLAVGRFGSREQLDVVEKHLGDTTVLTAQTINNNQQTYTCQLRDVALAVALHLTEQNVSAYGFRNLQKNQQYLYQPNNVGFSNAADRDAAFRKWHAWKAAQQTEPATAELPGDEPPATNR